MPLAGDSWDFAGPNLPPIVTAGYSTPTCRAMTVRTINAATNQTTAAIRSRTEGTR